MDSEASYAPSATWASDITIILSLSKASTTLACLPCLSLFFLNTAYSQSSETLTGAWIPANITASVWTQLNYAFVLNSDDYKIAQIKDFGTEQILRF